MTELIIAGLCVLGALGLVSCALAACLCKAAGNADEKLGYK